MKLPLIADLYGLAWIWFRWSDILQNWIRSAPANSIQLIGRSLRRPTSCSRFLGVGSNTFQVPTSVHSWPWGEIKSEIQICVYNLQNLEPTRAWTDPNYSFCKVRVHFIADICSSWLGKSDTVAYQLVMRFSFSFYLHISNWSRKYMVRRWIQQKGTTPNAYIKS